MALAPTALPASVLRARSTALALVATFTIGVLTGLFAPKIALPLAGARPEIAAGIPVAAVDSAAYQSYRSGERADLIAAGSASQPETLRAWRDYRAGERADLTVVDAGSQGAALRAWLDYRAGERGELTP
jgi:hypothetical protein